MTATLGKTLFLAAILMGQAATGTPTPANVCHEGEPLRVVVPDAWSGWRVVDIDGKEVHRGTRGGEVGVGKLLPGYYELREEGRPGLITAAVVRQVKVADDTPIAIDAAMSWFYSDPQQIRDACRLC